MSGHFEVDRGENDTVRIIWGEEAGPKPILECTLQAAKELNKLLDVIVFHGELNPGLQMRLTVEPKPEAQD